VVRLTPAELATSVHWTYTTRPHSSIARDPHLSSATTAILPSSPPSKPSQCENQASANPWQFTDDIERVFEQVTRFRDHPTTTTAVLFEPPKRRRPVGLPSSPFRSEGSTVQVLPWVAARFEFARFNDSSIDSTTAWSRIPSVGSLGLTPKAGGVARRACSR
jgi:hypothetical protein